MSFRRTKLPERGTSSPRIALGCVSSGRTRVLVSAYASRMILGGRSFSTSGRRSGIQRDWSLWSTGGGSKTSERRIDRELAEDESETIEERIGDTDDSSSWMDDGIRSGE
ncbi:hypothetical protein KM043_015612 [Ampulex compressa]|nr:hypothetical protein KM043_015612 [Ampulex compressa]